MVISVINNGEENSSFKGEFSFGIIIEEKVSK